jgi:hypothetical protein
LNVACQPGEVIYLVISAIADESSGRPALVNWEIERSDMMPERFARRTLVLLYDGKWYVDAEPSQ